jgi:hypothetical protein
MTQITFRQSVSVNNIYVMLMFLLPYKFSLMSLSPVRIHHVFPASRADYTCVKSAFLTHALANLWQFYNLMA